MNGKQSTLESLLHNTNIPFTDAVMKFLLPEKFKVPQIENYDWTKDQVEHIETYCAHFDPSQDPIRDSLQSFPLYP